MRTVTRHIWCWFSVFFVTWRVGYGSPLSSQSSLCGSMDMPCNQERPEVCQMKYYKLNSTECRDMIFDEKVSSLSQLNDLLGTFELKSFYYNILSYKMTVFNVTFSNIKWTHLKFRYRQIGNDMKNTCREFFVVANASVTDLFYDCVWSNETYEGKPFFFEFEMRTELFKVYRRFSFQVPFAKNVDEAVTQVEDWETFTYVEAVPVSNGLGPTTFILYWQPLPDKFSVDEYNISVWSNGTGKLEIINSLVMKCIPGFQCSYMYSKWYGTLQFGIQPICKNVQCLATYTLLFQVGGEKAKPLLIGILCATFLVPFVLYVFYMTKKYMAVKEITLVKTKPKVLFIYSSSVSSHVNVVLDLAEYLYNHCNVEPMVDELHIFSSKSKDPFKWCNNAFKSADCVMVIASPASKKRITNSVYNGTDRLLLRLLRESLASSYHKKTKFFVLSLPYTTEKDIPAEAINLRRFTFPRDLNKILGFIHEKLIIRAFLYRELHGGKRDYKIYGKKLNTAIEQAQQCLKNIRENIESRGEREIEWDRQILTRKERNPSNMFQEAIKNKESLKEKAKEFFMEYPGPLERINLLGEDGEEAEGECERVRQPSSAAGYRDVINISELNL